MNKSFIYSDLSTSLSKDELGAVGWFETPETFKPLDSEVSYMARCGIPERFSIDNETLIAYFPGCFAEFHIGHLDVVNQTIEACKAIADDNYLVVVSPANTDYTTGKYGVDSLFATNKYRYDRITSMLANVKGNVVIDLNPMLNFELDYNFTDLIHDFVIRQGFNWNDLVHVPRIVCGKDRKYFADLVAKTNQIDVIYVDDTTGASSSALIRKAEVTKVAKKDLLLRCDNLEQYELFKKFFEDQYNLIACQLISEEIEVAKSLHKDYKFDVTICKDYTDFLPYISTHRSFQNPLSSGDGHLTRGNFKDLKVLDSDVFSGGTRDFIESQGGHLFAVFDFSNDLDKCELLDIAGFYTAKWQYPYVDISSRCSMRAFTYEDHKNFQNFRTELQKIERYRK